MSPIRVLLRPRWGHWRLNGRSGTGLRRIAVVLSLGAAFWSGLFIVSFRVLTYFQQVAGFGDILAFKLLNMILLTMAALLMFSAVLVSLAKFYLSKDLLLVHSMPVSADMVFAARWLETLVDSSWMVMVYALPVMLSYGLVFHAGAGYYVFIPLALFPLCATATAISALGVMTAVIALPANRLRSIVVLVGILGVVVLYVAFRLIQPERLVDPDSFASVLAYMRQMQTPASAWLPTTWAFDGIRSALTGNWPDALFHVALGWSGAGAVIGIVFAAARWWYFPGFSKSQTAGVRLMTAGERLDGLFAAASGPTRAFLVKEIRTFWRDHAQWSQLILLGALVAIYLYNFSVLPLDKAPIKTVYLQNLFAFLNMGLAGLVVTAITARFAFPSVSGEGRAFWIVRAAPIAIRRLLWIKWAIYLVPLTGLALILVVASNLLLDATAVMMAVSVGTLAAITPGVVAMGVGLGAAFPDFEAENAAQTVTGFGGLLLMIYSAIFIGAVLSIEAGPTYTLVLATLNGRPIALWQWGMALAATAAVTALCILAVWWPMRMGARLLERRDR